MSCGSLYLFEKLACFISIVEFTHIELFVLSSSVSGVCSDTLILDTGCDLSFFVYQSCWRFVN